MDEPEPVLADDGVLAGWYAAHRVELLRLAALALGDRSRAEDVVHDVFAAVHRTRPVLRAGDRVLPYLRSAVLNRCRTGITLHRTAGRTSQVLQRDIARAAGGGGRRAA